MSADQGVPAAPPPQFIPGNFPTLFADHVRVNVHSMTFVISFGQLRPAIQPDGSTNTVIFEVARFSISPLTLAYFIRGLIANIGWYNGTFGPLPDPDVTNSKESFKASADGLTKALAQLTLSKKK